MKNIILIKFLIILLLSATNSFAGKYPNIPKGVDHKTYCDDKGGKYGHVIVVVDLTTKLDKARIEFIKDQVFSKEFYLKYEPFTKFSYFLIDNNEPTKQKFLFSKNHSFLKITVSWKMTGGWFQGGFWCPETSREEYLESFYIILFYYFVYILVILRSPFLG